MIYEANVPAVVRQWANLVIETSKIKKLLSLLDQGYPRCAASAQLLASLGRGFYAPCGKDEKELLRERIERGEKAIKAIESENATPPSDYLISKDELFTLVGSTLKIKETNEDKEVWVYETIEGIDEEGEGVYSERSNLIDPIELLSHGFGKGITGKKVK